MVIAPTRIAIVGATASGKSALGMAVVRALRANGCEGEIVSMDSMAIYRGLDIGTAKPSLADRAEVAHHLLDIVEPDSDFAVGELQPLALAAIADIEVRRAIPVLVGGTGLYVDAVIDELTIPGQYPAIRDALQAEPDTELLHARLVTVDPTAASRMEPTNRRRIIRALEVTIGSGRPFSSYGPGLAASQRPNRYRLIGVERPRDTLTERITERFTAQMDAGFLAEAAALQDRYGSRLSRTAGQALGYRELWHHLAGQCSLEEAIDVAVLRTRQFAVRQQRWFRRDVRIEWFAPDASEVAKLAERVAAGFLP